MRWEDLVQRSLFGGVAVNPDPPHKSRGKPEVLAARVKGR